MSDKLDRALGALRERESGENARAEETLERVLASQRAARWTSPKRATVWLLLAATLAVGTTALARSGIVETMRALVTRYAEAPLAVPSVVPAVPASAAPSIGEAPESVPSAPEIHETPALPPLPSPSAPRANHPVSSARVAVAPSPASAAAPADAPSTSPAPSATTAPETLPNVTPEESALYTNAHRLHFGGTDPAAAIAAWDDYLARFPQGRFVPDARFNRAIDLLKTKQYSRARAELQPFAGGAYGAYHQSAARELLESVPELGASK